jgi:chaperonin GroEL (HSP60 family)
MFLTIIFSYFQLDCIFLPFKRNLNIFLLISNIVETLNSTEVERIIFKAKEVLDVATKYLIEKIISALLPPKNHAIFKTLNFTLEYFSLPT